ncbi:Glutamate decarboxylase 1 [Eumeta japonica]|uniref:Glutamate decarboxylase 1 n=1 Tax=Eumeta variegata TaxID=151549 RepID=A0A4C1UJY7_EUMVA|nr:Glutamate decarboxylase 1 [Eumeta japonica]
MDHGVDYDRYLDFDYDFVLTGDCGSGLGLDPDFDPILDRDSLLKEIFRRTRITDIAQTHQHLRRRDLVNVAVNEILDLDVTKGVNGKELEECIRQVLEYCVKTNKGTFRNQLYGAVDPNGLAGAWLAEACNTSQYTYEVAPAFTLIELQIIEHVLKKFGISDGDGIFSPGGSASILYAITAARFKAFPQVKTKGMRNLPEMIIFTSEDSHYSVRKAAHWLGFGTDSVRLVRVNEHGQMLTDELEVAIKDELTHGRHPLFVNATAGTTVLGAIDDLERVADVCQKYHVWMHVDACWGGSLILSSQHKHKLQGIQKANSISWNPHKMAGAPLQCSLFLVREKELLHKCNSASAQYLFQADKFYDTSYDTGDKSVQCGRKIDAFKLWTMWKARGDSGLSNLLDQTMKNAQFCMETLATKAGFRLVSPKLQCPNICFWYIPACMRGQQETDKWWETLHKVTADIKELLMVDARLMIAYSPLRQHRNFFRLALTFHPVLRQKDILEMLQNIEECGEIIGSRLTQ